jgi:uncharacterized membrane-anchored protein YhcB (DUF1043 family)
MTWWLLAAFGALAGINVALLIASLRALEKARRLRNQVTVEAARLRAKATELDLMAEQIRQ